MRILFLTFFLLVSNQSFAEWKYTKGSLKDDGKITERTYKRYEEIKIDGKIKKSKLTMTNKVLSWKISKNYKKGNNCEPFQIASEMHISTLLDKMYITNECAPCIDQKGLCGRKLLISHFQTRESFDYLKSGREESKWHKELEEDGGKILSMDKYDSVYRSIHIAFGNREMLMIESRKVEYQNQIYPTYRVAVGKFNTKNRDVLTKISNFTDIYEKEIIMQIEVLFSRIYDALEKPKAITISDQEAKIIFASHVDATHLKFQTRD